MTLDSDKEGEWGRGTGYLSVHYLLNAKDRDGEEWASESVGVGWTGSST